MKEQLKPLFEPVQLGALSLKNSIVMAPMTRSRAAANGCVSDLHRRYYQQRASAGLIIAEGTQPSADGQGYCRTPGIHNAEQIAAWKTVTDAVHAEGGKMVLQLMHVGRVAHPDNQQAGTRILAPSAIAAKAEIFTEGGMKPCAEPEAMSLEDIAATIADYRQAALNALEAGFDGVELHCTSGYLPAQFLSTGSNQRDDDYGGSLSNRLRFPLEVVDAIAAAIGSDRLGLRICPGNPFNDLQDQDPQETFEAFVTAIAEKSLAYLHVIRMPPSMPVDNIALAQRCFKGPLIVNESYKAEEAAEALASQETGAKSDTAAPIAAVSFGRDFIANPDLPARIAEGADLAKFDMNTLYTPGEAGYCDYPSM